MLSGSPRAAGSIGSALKFWNSKDSCGFDSGPRH